MALIKAAIALNAGEGNNEHAHSHPESRLHKTRWTRNDNGNFIADRVAVGDYGTLAAFMQINTIETSNTFDVITYLACIQTWFDADS